MVSEDRGQAYTLEGVLGAILVVTAVVYGLQAIDTRAWQSQTDQNTQQLQNRAGDLLTVAGESGALREATLCYRDSRRISGSDSPNQRGAFEDMLNQTFDSRGDQYNLYFSWWNRTDERETTIASSLTADNADRAALSVATASTTVTLTDDMRQRIGNDCSSRGPKIENSDGFYIQKNVESTVYNVVEVRLVVW